MERLADIDFLACTDFHYVLRKKLLSGAQPAARSRPIYAIQKQSFRLPLETGGTDFQRRVWNALQRIPAGKVLSYGELARKLKTGPRAVGNACRANPIPVVIPCHRVVAANGKGGFMGKTGGKALAIKDWLLTHERGR